MNIDREKLQRWLRSNLYQPGDPNVFLKMGVDPEVVESVTFKVGDEGHALDTPRADSRWMLDILAAEFGSRLYEFPEHTADYLRRHLEALRPSC